MHLVSIDTLAKAGGLFVVFAFVHVVADFWFQSHDEAMAKHNNWKVRASHCLTYVGCFMPLFLLLGWVEAPAKGLISAAVLFVSHFIEDTYWPVVFWATFFRRHPAMRKHVVQGAVIPTEEGFREFISTPLGALLMVAIDQIIHLTFLWVPVALALRD